MTDLFDYVNSITHNKKDIMRASANIEAAEKEYVPYVVNRTLSYYEDCVLYANEVNMRPNLENLLQYDFYINSLRPRKRFAKWAKPKKDSDVKNVMEYYGYGRSKAEEAVRSLNSDQLKEIAKSLERGGRT
jgi:hypothetical protein